MKSWIIFVGLLCVAKGNRNSCTAVYEQCMATFSDSNKPLYIGNTGSGQMPMARKRKVYLRIF